MRVFICVCACVCVCVYMCVCTCVEGGEQGEREVGVGRLEDVVAPFLICHNATVAHQCFLACGYRKVCSDS